MGKKCQTNKNNEDQIDGIRSSMQNLKKRQMQSGGTEDYDTGNTGLNIPEKGIFDTRLFFNLRFKWQKGYTTPPKHPDPEVTFDDDKNDYFWNGETFDQKQYD